MLGGKLDGGREILVRGGEHGEDITIALGEQLARCTIPLDHRHFIFSMTGRIALVRPEP